MSKKKQDDFFVGIADPLEIRRTLLESSREVIQTLQRYEEFKKIRDEKKARIQELKSAIKDITKLVVDLKKSLPKTELRIKLHKEAKRFEDEILIKPKLKKTQVVSSADMSELEKLEAELSNIESKLNKLA